METPDLVPCTERIRVVFAGVTLADTTRALTFQEPERAPVYFVPPGDIQMRHLFPTPRGSLCEHRGVASFYDVRVEGQTARNAAWSFQDPVNAFRELRGYLAFSAAAMEQCLVGERSAAPEDDDPQAGWST